MDYIVELSPNSNVVNYILCYPLKDIEQCRSLVQKRINCLMELGVTHIILGGPVDIGRGVRVLGKGFSSIVLKALWRGKEVLLKIRRLDSRRDTLEHEAQNLALANRVGVGPTLYTYTRDFIVREYVNGITFNEWVNVENCIERVKHVVKEVILQCYKLDSIGLDHGELSRPQKHIIINTENEPPKVYIIDFESASKNRKPHNVTSFLNFIIFRKSEIALKMRKMLGLDDNSSLRELLTLAREYKRNISFNILREIMRKMHLTV